MRLDQSSCSIGTNLLDAHLPNTDSQEARDFAPKQLAKTKYVVSHFAARLLIHSVWIFSSYSAQFNSRMHWLDNI